ncbi:DUF3226 domain-containing protein [Vibrio vulnificus]
MEKVCVVFCEGQHDIAFLSRILKVNGYSGYDKKIKEFLSPFDNIFIKQLEKKKVSDRKLGFNSDFRVPSVSLCRGEERLVFFHNMGGDGKARERRELIEMYTNIKGEDDFTSEYSFEFRFIFIFDADDLGVDTRIQEINNELGYGNVLTNGQLTSYNGHEWGVYIFHGSENGGVLEDIIIDMVTDSEREIIDRSANFLAQNALNIDRTKEFVCTSSSQSYKAVSKYKHKKSLLSVAGQLQFSGMSNAVFIANSDFLSYQSLTNNVHCRAIAGLFE